MEKLIIIGAGTGSINNLTKEAIKYISLSKDIYTSEERFKNFKEINNRLKIISFTNLEKTIRNNKKDISIIVGGDYGFYSIAKTLIKIFENEKEIILINGLNSMQYFASKLKKSYQNWSTISMHGTNKNALLGQITYNKNTFILPTGQNKAKDILKFLKENNLNNIKIYIGQNLGYKNEEIFTISLNNEKVENLKLSELTVILIENNNFIDNKIKYNEEESIISREMVHSIANKLNIKEKDIICSFGLGLHNLELSSAVKKGLIYSFESQNKENILKNAKESIGIYNIINSNKDFFENNLEFKKSMNDSKIIAIENNFNIKNILKLGINFNCKMCLILNSIQSLTETMNFYNKLNINIEILEFMQKDLKTKEIKQFYLISNTN